ncbi:MAG: hypothetical protein HF978_21815 [Desulfobacteraceae bacterium]|nr:transposase [Desulfobacteraceae bacterium]MBC2758185.1 hypothetical protein [Desulfobacteraceae bacterium]
MSVSRKTNRLSSGNYSGKQIYFITMNTANRENIFIAENIVNEHLTILKHVAHTLGFDVLSYCFMPNHLHLLVAGKHENSELISFVKKYKQISGFAYKRQNGKTLWQKSYFDHVLRKNEDISDFVQYILANPVRKNIVERPRDYLYSGSFVYGDAIFE